MLELENVATRRTARARVVWGWFGDSRRGSRFRLGVEFLEAPLGFWGAEYERLTRGRDRSPAVGPREAAPPGSDR